MLKKILYLARHAKSDWKRHALSDFERPLNSRGQRDAQLMASILKAKETTPDLILSSPAIRAKETAHIYHHALDGELHFDVRIYEASHLNLYYIAQEAFQKVDHLMIVGHNPGLTDLHNILSDTPLYNLVTGAIVAIVFEKKIERHRGKQLFFEYPKKYLPQDKF